jgi:hypothetical protein
MPDLSVELIQKAVLHVRGNGLWCDRALNLEGVPMSVAARWLREGRDLVQEGHVDEEESLVVRLALSMDYAESVCLKVWLHKQEACKNSRDQGQWQRYDALIKLRFPELAGRPLGKPKDGVRTLEQELAAMPPSGG